MFPHISHQLFPHITGLGLASRHVNLFQLLIILQRIHPEAGIFRFQIIFKKFFPFPIDPVVDIAQIQNKIKDIITGDDPTVISERLFQLTGTHICIIFKEIGTVISGVPVKLQFFRNHIQYGCLSRSISPIQNRNRLKVQHG